MNPADEHSPFSLAGRRAALTGAMGRVGRGIARALALAGAETVLLDVDLSAADEVVAGLVGPAAVHCRRLDLTDLEHLEQNISELEQELGPIDIWINSAYPRTGRWGLPLEQETPADWRANLDMQLNSYCLSSRAAAQRMARRGSGSIVNLASIYGLVAPDFGVYQGTDKSMPGAYAAVKGGIVAYSRWLASYFGPRGVRVNVVCPGAVASGQQEPFLSQYNRRTLLGRMAGAEEIGHPVVFLASDAASYITGAVLPIDGGLTAV